MALGIVIAALIALFLLFRLLIYLSNVQPEIYKSRHVYADHSEVPQRPFFSKKYLLAGKPDLVIHNADGYAPVEVKSGFRPHKPYGNHILQLASYCLLLEENGKKPKHGLLQYNSGVPFKIDYTDELKKNTLAIIQVMRKSVKENKLFAEGHDSDICKWCAENAEVYY